ncbi:MAG TPA: PEP-CTERM sorting domain-containing protein [Leptolyngbyaceae cyanobacterium]
MSPPEQFLSGGTISGQVDGDLQNDGDSVINLSNLVAEYSGKPGNTFSFFAPFGQSPKISYSGLVSNFFGFAEDPNTATAKSNFGFRLETAPNLLNGATVGNFSTSQFSIFFPFGVNQREAEVFNSERWQLSEVKTVPEPGTIAGLSLLGLSLLAAKKRHRVAKKV